MKKDEYYFSQQDKENVLIRKGYSIVVAEVVEWENYYPLCYPVKVKKRFALKEDEEPNKKNTVENRFEELIYDKYLRDKREYLNDL